MKNKILSRAYFSFVTLTLLLSACAAPAPAPTATLIPTPTQPPTATPVPDPVLIGVGDIADCQNDFRFKTAALIEKNPTAAVFTAGDNAYPNGTRAEFLECYDPSWGKFKERTYPSPGNHEYNTRGGAPYFDYFGARAGERPKGYYSFDLGTWHIISLNSNCIEREGCTAEAPQMIWLREDLAKSKAKCTLAFWHHPFYSMDPQKSLGLMKTAWQILYEAGADVVVNGHDHNYQRFAPQDTNGKLDLARGLREFVVGTGGRDLYQLIDPIPNVEVFSFAAYGVMKFTLHPTSYSWEFIPIEGYSFTDKGTDTCH